jgi:hypothetical protein
VRLKSAFLRASPGAGFAAPGEALKRARLSMKADFSLTAEEQMLSA